MRMGFAWRGGCIGREGRQGRQGRGIRNQQVRWGMPGAGFMVVEEGSDGRVGVVWNLCARRVVGGRQVSAHSQTDVEWARKISNEYAIIGICKQDPRRLASRQTGVPQAMPPHFFYNTRVDRKYRLPKPSAPPRVSYSNQPPPHRALKTLECPNNVQMTCVQAFCIQPESAKNSNIRPLFVASICKPNSQPIFHRPVI